jgi:hypothetical protein
LLRLDILEEIKRAHRGCPLEKLDYYRTRELIVTEYVDESYTPVDHHIKNLVVSEGDLKTLLDEQRKVQDPENELYQSWFKEETRQA